MTDQERADNKYDRGTGVKKKCELTINELCQKSWRSVKPQMEEKKLCNKQ